MSSLGLDALHISARKPRQIRKEATVFGLEWCRRLSRLFFFRDSPAVTFSAQQHFKDGDKLCNALKDNDCVTVSGGAININMADYPKVYVKQ